MLGEEFDMWSADSFPNVTFIMVCMHVTSLGYLENGPLCFTELLDGGIKESNRMLIGLDTAAIIPDTDK